MINDNERAEALLVYGILAAFIWFTWWVLHKVGK